MRGPDDVRNLTCSIKNPLCLELIFFFIILKLERFPVISHLFVEWLPFYRLGSSVAVCRTVKSQGKYSSVREDLEI